MNQEVEQVVTLIHDAEFGELDVHERARRLFPDLQPDEVHALVREAWDVDGPLPVPRFDVLCLCSGVLSRREVLVRHWRFHHRGGGSIGERCDMSFKCTLCSHVWVYGIVVPSEMHGRWRPIPRMVGWREGRDAIEAHCAGG